MKKKFVTDNFYSESYADDAWKSQLLYEGNLLLERIKNIRIFKKGSNVLDVGCGSGELGGLIKKDLMQTSLELK